MQKYGEEILNYLNRLKGGGKFATVKEASFVFPGLEIAGLGEIAFPVNKLQAEVLIQKAQKTPFGKGSETVYDDEVRSGWEMNAGQLSFNNPQWLEFINKAVENVKPELGLEGYDVEAHLYKLLIYKEGDFFLEHKDSEKQKGMFGTLIVNLPSRFTGGELAVRFEGEEVLADFSKNTHTIGYTAFYADCDHEVMPVISGYRLCLTYNLVQKKKGDQITLQSIHQHADRLTGIFKTAVKEKESKPFIILLGHQYTLENFSADALKLDDRHKAEVLLRAAEQAGYYARMCLVTSYVMGTPAYDGYYGGYDDADEGTEMDEVIEETIEIEHWVRDQYPDLGRLYIDKEDLIAAFNLEEEEPLEKENSGYMGNYGPDISYWYHYGAVMVWSQQAGVPLLLSRDTHTQLEWIHYFNHKQDLNEVERELADAILKNGLNENRSFRGKEADYNIIAQWLINQENKTFLIECNVERLRLFFEKIDTEHWIKLFTFLPLKINRAVFEKLAQEPDLPVLEKWLEIVKCLFEEKGFSVLAKAEMEAIPGVLKTLDAQSLRKISRGALGNLFWIARFMPSTKAWSEKTAQQFSEIISGEFIHKTLGPQLLAEDNTSLLSDLLRRSCCDYLQEQVDDVPQEPQNWSRSVPGSQYHKKEWNLLKDFLLSPTATVFDYKATKGYREDMEQAIKRVTIDLKMETIRKGSPHTLRLTKTKAAYQRAMKKWQEDKELLNKLKE